MTERVDLGIHEPGIHGHGSIERDKRVFEAGASRQPDVVNASARAGKWRL